MAVDWLKASASLPSDDMRPAQTGCHTLCILPIIRRSHSSSARQNGSFFFLFSRNDIRCRISILNN